jgi:hypothetical protein
MLGMRESYEDWQALGRDLIARGLGAPMLIVADGAPGLIKAIEHCWPDADRQHCAVRQSALYTATADRVAWGDTAVQASAGRCHDERGLGDRLAVRLERAERAQVCGESRVLALELDAGVRPQRAARHPADGRPRLGVGGRHRAGSAGGRHTGASRRQNGWPPAAASAAGGPSPRGRSPEPVRRVADRWPPLQTGALASLSATARDRPPPNLGPAAGWRSRCRWPSTSTSPVRVAGAQVSVPAARCISLARRRLTSATRAARFAHR